MKIPAGKYRMRIAVFGGTFDPPHLAHAMACLWALESGEVDRVYRYDDSSREECLEDAKQLAIEAARKAVDLP